MFRTLDERQDYRTTRQEGSLEDALKDCTSVTQVLKHESNDNYNVYVLTDENVERVYTNVSPAHLKEYSEWCKPLANQLKKQKENVSDAHGTKFMELMDQPGSKISDWHPTQRGTYSVHVQTKDGEKHVYTSISEAHMQQFCKNFEPGSTQVA